MEGPPLVPLHVPDAPHGLDLGVLSPKIGTVLVVPFFKQVLVASIAGILVPYPPADGREEQPHKLLPPPSTEADQDAETQSLLPSPPAPSAEETCGSQKHLTQKLCRSLRGSWAPALLLQTDRAAL